MSDTAEAKPDAAAVDPSGSAAVPDVGAMEAAVDAGEQGEEGKVKLDAVVSTLVDAGEVANRAAAIAASSTENMTAVIRASTQETEKARKLGIVLVAVAGGLMTVMAIVFATMTFHLSSRLTAIDAMIVAVGKRVVQLNTGIEQLESVEAALAKVQEEKAEKDEAVTKLAAKLDAFMAESRKFNAEQAQLAAKKDDGKAGQALAAQLKALEAQLQAQAKSVNRLVELQGSAQANQQAQAAKVAALSKSLDTLAAEKRKAPAPAPAPKLAAPAPAPAPAPVAVTPPPPKEKPVTTMVQYPNPALKKAGESGER